MNEELENYLDGITYRVFIEMEGMNRFSSGGCFEIFGLTENEAL